MDNFLKQAYSAHHGSGRRYGFSFELHKRAAIISNWIGSDKRILDVGCRDGVFTQKIIKDNTVVGTDIDPEALRICRKNLGISTLQNNINISFSFKDKAFDCVLLGEILEHTLSPKAVLCETARVLKPNGLLAGSVPNAFRLKNRLLFLLGKNFDPDPTHLHQFSVNRLQDLLAERFEVLEIQAVFGRFTRFSTKLFGNTIMFFCKKRG